MSYINISGGYQRGWNSDEIWRNRITSWISKDNEQKLGNQVRIERCKNNNALK